MPKKINERDAVDHFRDQWTRERPDLDGFGLDIWGRLKRGAALLDRRIERVTLAHGLNLGAFEVLAALKRSGPPYQLRPSELTRSLIVTPGTITSRLDPLERRGLVERVRVDSDRRAFLVLMTDAGHQVFDAAFDEVLRMVEHTLSASAVSQAALNANLRTLVRYFEQHTGADDVPER